MKYKQVFYQVLSVSIGLYASNSIAQSVNKCTINGKVTYQSTPCPVAAKAKAVDTTDKNAALGKDFAKSAKADKAKLDAIEKEREQKAARERAAENGMNGEAPKPAMRNLAIERIEEAAKKLK
jgi:hypothetical protein